jgi:peptide deformylase
MPVRPLVLYPDKHLAIPAAPVTDFGAPLAELIADLSDTLHEHRAIGITGPHIGMLRRVTLIRLPDETGAPRVYVNPTILSLSDETVEGEEGSVSMPGLRETVRRAARVRVGYQDEDGAAHEMEADDFLAIVLQHEIDQLDGLFWLGRLSRLKRERLVKKYEKSQKVPRVSM